MADHPDTAEASPPPPGSGSESGSGPRWRRRKDARPSELLDAALAVFIEKGFAAARTEDIARAAGVTKGTVYLYFPSKQAIFEAVVRRTVFARLDRVQSLFSGHRGPVAPVLRRVIEELGTEVATTDLAAVAKLVIAEAGNFPDIARFYRKEVIARGETLFGHVYGLGRAAGEFPDLPVETVTKLIMGPVLIAAIWRTTFAPVDDRPFDPAALIRAHARVLTAGLGALALEERP
ncbi:TetR/AcrR family transcriptional regulator [Zavarzinia compransoris]|uniref:TetR/AcrR family transcriptional regulator n=1 Tax=Zavarzinia marina TaxID=2911065 RepID=UPI001F41018F|nr:TetR/AcrR family transcriptional regulator [Zavarzinia marina]MCF4167167.1 TetR/AcrR family transcriptional regulator [Zavarzinia marina]